MIRKRHLWGESSTEEPTVPFHYPLLAVLAIVGSVAVTTWFLPRSFGYRVSFGILLMICIYGVLFTRIHLTTDPAFLVLFGGYWLGLVVHYYLAPHEEILQYIHVTPVAVYATVIVLPQFINGRRETFAMAVTVVAVVSVMIGLMMLRLELQSGEELYPWVAQPVMGIGNLRIVSVFHNPNTYGFFMMVGSLSALYAVLKRWGLVWICAILVCLVGLVLSEGDAALIGFAVGTVVVLSGEDRRLAFMGLALAIFAVYIAVRLGHISQVLETTLIGRIEKWIASFERLAETPLRGIGFIDPGPAIGEDNGPHNSYVHILLHTGVIAGMLYIGAIIYALGQGIRKRWTTWNAYVVGTATSTFLFMSFETLTLGGLSVTSVTLGVIVGLLLLPDQARDEINSRSSAREALTHSRVGQALKRVKKVS